MDKPNIVQSHNTVAGDIVSGNKYILHEKKNPLKILVENYRKEIENSEEHKKFIEDLENFMEIVPGNRRDLEKKLNDANYNFLLPQAKFLKEKFTKKLHKHTFSPKAQRIFVEILSMIYSSFGLLISPLLKKNEDSSNVTKAIYHEIIEKIYNDVGGDSDIEIDIGHIQGMLYYLTGNCYIDWD